MPIVDAFVAAAIGTVQPAEICFVAASATPTVLISVRMIVAATVHVYILLAAL